AYHYTYIETSFGLLVNLYTTPPLLPQVMGPVCVQGTLPNLFIHLFLFHLQHPSALQTLDAGSSKSFITTTHD
ncbi:hypothetical protein PAXINDRAFT_170509, partial [Paxillus involutus ATCC 200175]